MILKLTLMKFFGESIEIYYIMIRWRINKKRSLLNIVYNESPLLSYMACGKPHSPVIDQRLINDIDNEIDTMMDIIKHKKCLSSEINNSLIVKEMLGL